MRAAKIRAIARAGGRFAPPDPLTEYGGSHAAWNL